MCETRLTGRSSRTPEVPFPGRRIAQLQSTSGLRAGRRLNYGVRGHLEVMSQTSSSKATSWVWLVGFFVLAAYYLASCIRTPSPHYALSAFGFFGIGLHAFKRPVSFTGPIWPQVTVPRASALTAEILGVVGVVLAVAGAIWRWYAP